MHDAANVCTEGATLSLVGAILNSVGAIRLALVGAIRLTACRCDLAKDDRCELQPNP